MCIWDIHPGYLTREELLAEHAALHGVASALRRTGKNRAEPLEAGRWRDCRWALSQCHRQVAAEMALRRIKHQSPLRSLAAPGSWPASPESPAAQFELLRQRREGAEGGEREGRIGLPRTSHELWAHHKYSVMARDQSGYRQLGRRVSELRGREQFDELALELVGWLRRPPTPGNLRNAVQHMWGHSAVEGLPAFEHLSLKAALKLLQADCAGKANYLSAQTATADLVAWL